MATRETTTAYTLGITLDKKTTSTNLDTWVQPTSVLAQLADIVCQATQLEATIAPDGKAFKSTSAEPKPGIHATRGTLADDIANIQLELLRAHPESRIAIGALFTQLGTISEKAHLLPPAPEKDGTTSLWIELKVQATPLSLPRADAFMQEIKKLHALAKSLQDELPAGPSESQLADAYAQVAEFVEPIQAFAVAPPDELAAWGAEIWDLVAGSLSVALIASHPLLEQCALGFLAHIGQTQGQSLARLSVPAINARGLIELSGKVPGTLVVPANRLSVGSNPYEIGTEIQNLLGVVAGAGQGQLFTGAHGQLQAVFHGGQGGINDPLAPAVRHIPELPLATLSRFAVEAAGRRQGGLSPKAIAELEETVGTALEPLPPSTGVRILPALANREVQRWNNGQRGADDYAERIVNSTETLAGVTNKPRAARAQHVQQRFVEVMTDPELLRFFQDELLAQDEALQNLVSRLRTECLTRPIHQPLRYCAQGTPGTGKSESATMLAERLGVPYINIDAASMPDYYTASAQLLGSGRGIVGSHQSGRLEQAAKHHDGAVVEISDLDHAAPQVRTALGDLFLQVMGSGEAQSATGSMFSCANLIFAFTINLPDGMDEKVHRGFGFGGTPSDQEVQDRVTGEIKGMLSSAFLSRIGQPILFAPLDGQALATILERVLREAIYCAAERLDIDLTEIHIDAGVGQALLHNREHTLSAFGARGLQEEARSQAAQAFLGLVAETGIELDGHRLAVHIDDRDQLLITRA